MRLELTGQPLRLLSIITIGSVLLLSGCSGSDDDDMMVEDTSRPPAFNGGVAVFDTTDFSTSVLIEDEEATGRSDDLAIIDANNAYLIRSISFQNNTLVQFDPNTGTILSTAVAGLDGVDVRALARGPAGNLWVSVGEINAPAEDAREPRIVIINPADNSVINDGISTVLNPGHIVFGDNGNGGQAAVVQTAASDFSAGAVALVDSVSPYNVQTELNGDVSDILVRAFEDNFYQIASFNNDRITRYRIADPTTAIFQASTIDDDETVSGNPHDLVILNANKGYLIRYGSPVMWIVNPSATSAEEFKIGELELTGYRENGIPRATRAAIVDDKLFVVMQRLEADFAPFLSGAVAVFDTATDEEIDTGSDAAFLGAELAIHNPSRITVDPVTGNIFISGAGDLGSF